MDLPDYLAAADAASVLLADHRGQHRCTDSRYYGPQEYTGCPTHKAVGVLVDTLWECQTMPHQACHDPEHVDLVLLGMTGLVATDLAAEDAAAWRLTVQQALETHAALLDPSVTT